MLRIQLFVTGLTASFVLSLAGCGDDGGAGGDAGVTPACRGTHFAEAPIDWTLPDLGNGWANETADRFSDGVNFGLAELTGDARPDLVIAAGLAGTGTTRWVVYPNTGTAFAASQLDWALPNLGANWATETSDRFATGVNWGLLDMTGDKRADLVIASGAGPAGTGSTRWQVYESTGTGFAASPLDWALPNLGTNWAVETFDRFSDGINWGLLDLTGDGRPELVVTFGAGPIGTGSTRWMVYENTGTAFAGAPLEWAVPDLGANWASETFDRFSDGINWGLVDLTGDQRPDLVVTAGSGPVGTGSTRWVVYSNTGTGFAASTLDWALPNLGNSWASETFDRFSDGINWGLVDLTGDQRTDLVIAGGSGPVGTGSTQWLLYENEASGFSASTLDWAIPNLGNGWASETLDRFSDGINWSLIDLTGDERADLVLASGTGPVGTGSTRWLVHDNRCTE